MKARHRKNSEASHLVRVSASDIPMLRALRESSAKMLVVAKEIQAEETEPSMKLAAATVVAKIKEWYDTAGRKLDLLESTPPNWRPQ